MAKNDLIKLFRYYKGEKENPFKSDHDKGWFWHGEHMFSETGQSLESWAKDAAETRKSLTGKATEAARSLTNEQLGIVLYINELFIKWCPMEDADFIFNY